MHEAESSVQLLNRVKQLGVSIAVDDFGTGYSSLSYLRRLPLSKLKIDRSFVRDIISSRESAEIVRAIVSLARSLGLEVIAEGVESRAQLDALCRLGCDQFQGFYCSEPLPAAGFASLMVDWDREQVGSARLGPVPPVARRCSRGDLGIVGSDAGNF
jgi:EAL domain-containing protein (putative c-di-GMP-specific phosphodiesterase class I)